MAEKLKLEIAKRDLIVEISNLAEQSNGSVFVQYGETMILATAVMSERETRLDYFPLSVNYEEKFYAAGKIKGPRYVKREGRPTDEAICNSRLIDRAIRPLFDQTLKRDIQVITTILSWDGENDPDTLGLLASSLALSISDIPWQGPLAAVRVGRVEDKFILNPTYEQTEKSNMSVVFSAVESEKEILVNMIDGNFNEIDDSLILDAYKFAEPYLKKIIDFENKIIREKGKEKIIIASPVKEIELENEVSKILEGKLEKALFQKDKKLRKSEVGQLKGRVIVFAKDNYPEKINLAVEIFDEQVKKIVRASILEKEKRIDGRKLSEIRKLDSKVGLIPRSHGSGLFLRGQTKSLSILTLGAPGDVQFLEGMEVVGKKRFMHHYNFPPYSVGEARPIRGPGRREIGHGILAEKSLAPLIPSSDEFPYTIRIVSEILSSNGSTSMASVCSSSLALMDAGVPIKAPVAGISIGLIVEPGVKFPSSKTNYKLLTDILGSEDHNGDMDFKLAGTKKGATAIQMDIKVGGITEKIFKESIEKAKKSRLEILNEMGKTIEKARPKLSPHAPRILVIQINPEKIGKVIGPGGKIINEIIEECNVSIDIEETGKVFITAEKEEAAEKAVSWIKNITKEVKVGEIFQGKVIRILDFGAFVEILPGQDGLIHISKLAPYRVQKVTDIVKIGDMVEVKIISIDEEGRINLSLNDEKHARAKKRR
ncbi:MAG: polyribonucleotide nucleotidyltransferase [Patescibacteria group bacterium]|nr:polyribonucleotide nucleotidyltransferase [Patescibacteria group bacterium]